MKKEGDIIRKDIEVTNGKFESTTIHPLYVSYYIKIYKSNKEILEYVSKYYEPLFVNSTEHKA